MSWTHFRRIIYLDDPLKRDFYAEMCRIEKWNTRTLHQKIQSMCAGKSAEHVELLEVEKSGIHVAVYWTETLPKDLLRKKLHQAVATARALIGERKSAGENPT